MNGMVIHDYLKSEVELGKIDFILRARVDEEGDVHFYIHPLGDNGKTADYTVYGNCLMPKGITGEDVKAKWLREKEAQP